MNLRIKSTIGAVLDNQVIRCIVIGEVNTISNKVLIKRECDSKIFAIRPNLVVWVNEG